MFQHVRTCIHDVCRHKPPVTVLLEGGGCHDNNIALDRGMWHTRVYTNRSVHGTCYSKGHAAGVICPYVRVIRASLQACSLTSVYYSVATSTMQETYQIPHTELMLHDSKHVLRQCRGSGLIV